VVALLARGELEREPDDPIGASPRENRVLSFGPRSRIGGVMPGSRRTGRRLTY
jgi:hypothetical protein